MPKNSAFGVVIGGLSFVFGFAMVWHIWWLAALGLVLIALTLIVRSSDDDTEYLLPAGEVEKIETPAPAGDGARRRALTRRRMSRSIPGAALPGQAS